MNESVKKFIEENIKLIDLNTKESWEQIYNKIPYEIMGEFTETILDVGINDPTSKIGYIPKHYLEGSSIQNYSIYKNVTSIGGFAFYKCSSLTSVTIPNSVTSIDTAAFSDCDNLLSVIIPDSVTSIDNQAFEGCYNLTNIEIPSSVTSIGNQAFYNCDSLTTVKYMGDIVGWCNILFASSSANPLYNGAKLYFDNELVTSLSIPKTITEIKEHAFYNCSSLESVLIPNSVITIGDYAFSGCSNLTTVVIPHSVKIVDSFAFEDCDRLKELNFEGTKAKWNLLKKSLSWRRGSSIERIICTDGIIEL